MPMRWRMPTEANYESYADRLIREAMERGEFDDLPGAGRPIDGLGKERDPDWWAKGFLARDRARARADHVRRLIRDEVPRLRAMPDRSAAATRLAELAALVRAVNEDLPERDRIASPIG